MRLNTTDAPSKQELAQVFSDPPAEYGCVDGWWWDAGRIVKERLTWQLEQLKDKGISGTWFYARYVHGEPLGSDPAYFSDAWWELTKFAADEQERLGLLNWFSIWTVLQVEQDAVRAQREAHPELWGRKLAIARAQLTEPGRLALELDPHAELLDAAAYRLDGEAIDYASRVALTDVIQDGTLAWDAPAAGWVLTAIVAQRWDLNYLNADMADRWNDVVLGEYDRRMGDRLGTQLQAYGPDEMVFLDGVTIYSPDVLAAVQATYGYDLTPFLIGLFDDVGAKTEHIRCAYYEAVGALLEERFFRPNADWLHDRGMFQVTLSQVGRTPLAQTYHHGDFFRYVGSYDIPGNEDPGWQPSANRRLYQTKMSSSIAHLSGRSRVIVEAHYGAGWGHTLEENVAWTNAAYAKGLNCYTRHQAAYSLMGGWYEWVPPADHFFHPYWRYWRLFADYVRRLSYAMSQGHHRADVALLHPQTTIHANWVAGRVTPLPEGSMDLTGMGERVGLEQTFDPPAHEASEKLGEIATAIYLDGIDFDFVGDAALGGATVEGPVLKIGELEFRAIVLPSLTTVTRAVAEVMADFFEAGGTIVVQGRMPSSTVEHGRDDPRLEAALDRIFGEQASGGHSIFIPEDVAEVPAAISRAIVRDVEVSGKGTFHTHQRVGELDVYFLTNVGDAARDVTVRLRVDADVELWDSWSGETRPVERVTHEQGRTRLELRMEPYEGLLLVCSPRAGEPTTVATAAAASPDVVPQPIAIEGPLAFSLEPTMDNRWGDYRHPPTDTKLGAEARTFRCREEGDAQGTELGWHGASFDDGDWTEASYSYGPYWQALGPIAPDAAPEDLLERALRGDDSLDWEPFVYSQKFGSPTPEMVDSNAPGWEHLIGISENVIVLDGTQDDAEAPHRYYLRTTVESPHDEDYLLLIGRKQPVPLISLSAAEARETYDYKVPCGTRAWIDGDEVLAVDRETGAEVETTVRLGRGRHTVLLALVGPAGAQFAGYAVFLRRRPEGLDPYVPLLTWFQEPHDLVYDIRSEDEQRVGWYRFTAPPGTRELRLNVRARGVEAWVEGTPVAVEDGTIRLAHSSPDAVQVALRVEQHAGVYGGAAFDEPVAIACEQARIPLGDWSGHGLGTYSGIGVYGIDVNLTAEQVACRAVLDLGHVKTVADVSVNGRPVGVRLARPFRFDITEFVVEGENRIEVKVANTLANHMSTYPTAFVREGQTVSGLLGPVELRFLAPTRVVAARRS